MMTDPMPFLRDRAVALGLCGADASDEQVDDAVEALLERDVRVPTPTEEECRRWYEANPDAFVVGELVLARHILFAVTPRTPTDLLRQKAEETLLELRAHPERFEERARTLSNCVSGQSGGVLGQLSRGECVPEFESAVFGTTAAGIVPTLVKTRYGFHIVAVDRRVEGRRAPFEEVRARIAERLAREALQRALAAYADEIRRAA